MKCTYIQLFMVHEPLVVLERQILAVCGNVMFMCCFYEVILEGNNRFCCTDCRKEGNGMIGIVQQF